MIIETKILIDLIRKGLLISLSDPSAEIESQLQIIRKTKRSGYLNRYNLLFRYISVQLAVKGLGFSEVTPHKTLSILCNQVLDTDDISKMVKARHALKYDKIPPSAKASEVLEELIIYFGEWANEVKGNSAYEKMK